MIKREKEIDKAVERETERKRERERERERERVSKCLVEKLVVCVRVREREKKGASSVNKN